MGKIWDYALISALLVALLASPALGGIVTQNEAGSITDYFSATGKPVIIVIRNAVPDDMTAYVNTSTEQISVQLEKRRLFNEDRYEGRFYLYDNTAYQIGEPNIQLDEGAKATVAYFQNGSQVYKKLIAEYGQPSTVNLNLDTDTSSRTVYLDWSVSQDSGSGVQYYKVYKSDFGPITTLTKNSGTTQVFNTSNLDYADAGITSGRQTYYAVAAVDYAGNEAEISNDEDVYFIDTESPGIDFFNVINAAYGVNRLEWSVRDNNQLKRYELYRNGTLLKTKSLTGEQSGNHYRDIDTDDAMLYKYTLKVYDHSGNTANKTAVITTDSSGPQILEDDFIANNLKQLIINTDQDATCEFRPADEKMLTKMRGDRKRHESIISMREGYYKKFVITCQDEYGNGMDREKVITFLYDTTPPSSTDIRLAASIDPGDTEIRLRWDESNDKEMGSYEIRRATTEEALRLDESIVGESEGMVYVDTGFALDTTYFYAVNAKDAAGNRGDLGGAISLRVPDQGVNFYIIQPKANEIVLGDKVEILGKTDALSLVQVSIGRAEYTVSADKDGDFSLMVSLDEGKNDIVYTITDEHGNTLVKTVGVFMFTDKDEADRVSKVTGAAIIDSTETTTGQLGTPTSLPGAEQSKNWMFWIIAIVVALAVAIAINRNDPNERERNSGRKKNHDRLGMNDYLHNRKYRKK